MSKPAKTVKQLYDKFAATYTPNQISKSADLQKLYAYLSDNVKRANGNFYHIPDQETCDLIFTYLGVMIEEDEITYKANPAAIDLFAAMLVFSPLISL